MIEDTIFGCILMILLSKIFHIKHLILIFYIFWFQKYTNLPECDQHIKQSNLFEKYHIFHIETRSHCCFSHIQYAV